MRNIKLKKIGKEVVSLEIEALKKLKNSINDSFCNVVKTILNNKNGKIIISGVGKSGIIAKKWAATFSSTGTPSFFLDASSASHGDMGQITSNDVIILISNSGDSEELKNIIQYCSRNKNIKLIGITSKKESLLYKNSDISFLIPFTKEAGLGNIVPTSSTTSQLALGDAIAIACMNHKNFTNFDFKKFHPSGSLSIKLKTVSDVMLTGKKLPLVKENIKMKKALKIINDKKLGVLIIQKNNGDTSGIITDGDLKRIAQKFNKFDDLEIKKVMTKRPFSVEEDTLAASALSIMNTKKITSLCVHKKKRSKKTIGIIHMHDILRSNIS
ncbi:KpsF/GutQ family sugar-phosphate isomerase [Candidatus Pelagibacter sp.]|nr:KpsF/GutQ family sugar-phosphate isomerase [Candidatus Pelagibacter sp.]